LTQATQRGRQWWLIAGLLCAGVLAYANSLSLPFIFDDLGAVVANGSIRSWRTAWFPPSDGSATMGRPVVNLTFALNYALTGLSPWSYHALNLLVHLAAGLTLFGLVRRTLLRPRFRCRFGAAASELAFLVALLWVVHPLQTESVTCVAQRTESLFSLCLMFSVYSFVRGAESARPWRWWGLGVATCVIGMGVKEAMITTPLLSFLYDVVFIGGSLRAAWRERKWVHLAWTASWLPLVLLVLQTGGARGAAAGFGLGVPWWAYALTQCRALLLYLKLAFWPHPLVLDYGTDVIRDWSLVWPQLLGVAALLALTGWAWHRRLAVGFAGAWFIIIIAPSSSVVPLVAQTIAEHRMYLPLAAVITLAVVGVHLLMARWTRWIFGTAALVCLGMTIQRNQDYQSSLSIWTATVEARPGNARAHYNLAGILIDLNRVEEAMSHYQEALRINPRDVGAHSNLGEALTRLGRTSEAILHCETALRLDPSSVEARNNLGNALIQANRLEEALACFREAVRLRPEQPEANNNLGGLLLQLGQPQEGVRFCTVALKLRPDFAPALSNLGLALLQLERFEEAIVRYERLRGIEPRDASVLNNLGYALARLGRTGEAIARYQETLRLDSNNAVAAQALTVLGGAPSP
jgi:Flp pilus assembly protein TadD